MVCRKIEERKAWDRSFAKLDMPISLMPIQTQYTYLWGLSRPHPTPLSPPYVSSTDIVLENNRQSGI